MYNKQQHIKVLISGGGTGGHIFPAIAIADEIKHQCPNAEILFVGALGRMEMQRVPAAGYKIVGLPVSGFNRTNPFKNIKVFFNLMKSLLLARKIIADFKPQLAVGVGGYASGPMLRIASNKGIPTLIQEQNSYAGLTNKLLAKKVSLICVAYSGMEQYFPANKIVFTGNPTRIIKIDKTKREEAFQYFKLNPEKPVLAIIGGSLGARTLNESLIKNYDLLARSGVQVIWQTGGYYFNEIKDLIKGREVVSILVVDFISRMDLLYNIADLLISRAGAISISEICLTGKAAILVPSPNVAEDHQTKNAKALVKENAAVLVTDKEAIDALVPLALELIKDNEKLKALSVKSKLLARPNATKEIVNELLKIVGKSAS